MENLTLKVEKTIDSEVSLPQFFSIGDYRHFKILDSQCYLAVCNYDTDRESMNNLEVYPSIKVEMVRYLQYTLNGREVQEITEEEFNKLYKKCSKFIAGL
jgi:hypothetical protein